MTSEKWRVKRKLVARLGLREDRPILGDKLRRFFVTENANCLF